MIPANVVIERRKDSFVVPLDDNRSVEFQFGRSHSRNVRVWVGLFADNGRTAVNGTYRVLSEWDEGSISAFVLSVLSADFSKSALAKARKTVRSGVKLPASVTTVLDEIRKKYVELHGEDTDFRKEEIRKILRQLRGKLGEEELIQVWREVAVEEVHSS